PPSDPFERTLFLMGLKPVLRLSFPGFLFDTVVDIEVRFAVTDTCSMENLTPRHSYKAPSGPRTSVGRYQIECVIGRGGMGEVLKGIDPGSGKYVAVKVLDAEAYRDEDLLARFRREAQSALTLDHPNIAKFYELEHDEEGQPIIVMEFIEGLSMDAWLKANTDALFSQIVDFTIQAARGLENAFRRTIIHRDIKPSNLIVTPNNVVKIIDFGLAKSMWDKSALTGTGMVVGTPRYISPEQGMGRNVDHRSDIYSLGATLYELLTRQAPFDGETPLAIMMKHINTPLIPPYLLNPKVPSDVNEIVVRMMAKDPRERYQDYEPLIRDLESAKIHRLAKERRSSGMDSVQAGQAPTVMVTDNNGGSSAPTAFKGRPSSYLTEGLVDVSYNAPAETPQSNLSRILLAVSGVLVLGFAVAALMAPRHIEGKKQSSWFSQRVAQVFKRDKPVEQPTSPVDLAKDDAEKVRLTSSRMEAVVSKMLELRTSQPSKSISLRTVRETGGMSDEDTRDGWGNDFSIVQSGDGGGTLLASGRDGEEKSDDDFSYALDGSSHHIPPALKAEDFASSAETRSGSASK
ncbi:MAG: serine/threonine protein kinase, partial [Candidatus Sumerlaeaceae bacterium]